MQRNRFELKYLISERCARGISDFIRPYLMRDPFARAELGWAYPIYSVYLDGPGLELFYATVNGHKNRVKLRARYYDEDSTHPVFFEIKRRVNDIILKERAPVVRSSVKRLLAGASPVRNDLQDGDHAESWAALQEFCRIQRTVNAVGRTIVTYTREAWNAADNDDVRVTFDRRIAGSWYDDAVPLTEALRLRRAWIYPPADSEVVLELKFSGRYPRWMERLVAAFDLHRACMAKYVNCVIAMGPQGHGRWRDRRSAAEPECTHPPGRPEKFN